MKLGDVFTARFPHHLPGGHEQEGLRPAVVVGLPGSVGKPRFQVVFLTPLTSHKGQAWVKGAPALYPLLAAGTAGLPSASVALTDQTRPLDTSRLARYLGALSSDEFALLQIALRGVLAL